MTNTKFARCGGLLAASLFAATLPALGGCAAPRAEKAAVRRSFSRPPVPRQNRIRLDWRAAVSSSLRRERLQARKTRRRSFLRQGYSISGIGFTHGKRGSQRDERRPHRRKGRPSGVGLRRASHIAVMQAANFGNRDDRTEFRRFDRSEERR